MIQQIDAVYENGVLRPTQPLRLSEHERVRVMVVPDGSRAINRASDWRINSFNFEFMINPPSEFSPLCVARIARIMSSKA